MRRHDLIFVKPDAWRALLKNRDDLAAESLVADWAARGWPLVARRPVPGEPAGVPLGLPLPPSAGKRRIGFVISHEDVVSVTPPVALSDARSFAPGGWAASLDKLAALSSQHSVEVRVFGSLAWRTLTGLDYVTAKSDLDFLLYVGGATDLRALTAGIAVIETTAPMKLDGEIIREDGAAANWRDLHLNPKEVLVKTTDGVALMPIERFLVSQVTP